MFFKKLTSSLLITTTLANSVYATGGASSPEDRDERSASHTTKKKPGQIGQQIMLQDLEYQESELTDSIKDIQKEVATLEAIINPIYESQENVNQLRAEYMGTGLRAGNKKLAQQIKEK